MRGKNLMAAATKRLLALALIGLIGFATGCGPAAAPVEHKLAMAPVGEMPHEVQQASARVVEAYQFAFANPEILGQIPCYCGCASLGHKSNYDCYVAGSTSDSIDYDSHALFCLVCVDITHDTMRLLRSGSSAADIHVYVDSAYAGYGPSNMVPSPQ
jgi:hypothetical protein